MISMNHLPAQVKTLFLQVYLNGLLVYIPDGICTNTIYNILGYLQCQVRSMYLVSWDNAILDVVPKDFTTIPLIKQKALTQHNLLGEENFVNIEHISGNVKYSLVLDYAYALLCGMCSVDFVDIDYLCFNPKWRPPMSDHKFCLQGLGLGLCNLL